MTKTYESGYGKPERNVRKRRSMLMSGFSLVNQIHEAWGEEGLWITAWIGYRLSPSPNKGRVRVRAERATRTWGVRHWGLPALGTMRSDGPFQIEVRGNRRGRAT